MRVNSVAGVLLFVADLDKTTKFYEKIGFRPGKRDIGSQIMYINWFWLHFIQGYTKTVTKKPELMVASQFVYLSISDADEIYKELVAKGIKNVSKPKDFKTGRREVMISDPDGYKLVFFQKL